MLKAAGLDSLVADTPEQYRNIALNLYRTPTMLQSLRAQLAEARLSSPLFDMKHFAQNLEHMYRQMWRNYQSGMHEPILVVGSDSRVAC
jgi:protein O-GlcNAc transferase